MEVDVATTVQLRVQRFYSASYNGSFAIFISSPPLLFAVLPELPGNSSEPHGVTPVNVA
jgi:hypothetical protein